MAGYYFFSKYRNRHLCGVANMGMTEQQIIESLATKVMRWIEEDGWWTNGNGGTWVGVKGWNPLKNIADAIQLVDNLKDDFGRPREFNLYRNLKGEWIASLGFWYTLQDGDVGYSGSGAGDFHVEEQATGSSPQEAIVNVVIKVA